MDRWEVDKLAECVQCRLAGRVHGFRVLIRDNGFVLQGWCRSYHIKQLAQQFLGESTEVPLVANEIKVCQHG